MQTKALIFEYPRTAQIRDADARTQRHAGCTVHRKQEFPAAICTFRSLHEAISSRASRLLHSSAINLQRSTIHTVGKFKLMYNQDGWWWNKMCDTVWEEDEHCVRRTLSWLMRKTVSVSDTRGYSSRELTVMDDWSLSLRGTKMW